ncbi:hypothetical protein AYO40_02015 [Planctomycetaceae bacterium SCGC AG-212-D15]|nr:hypothetical protein AYO40_02015 [Planctomycetaceae bacterium SCGC AG-212-D15]
MQDNGGYIYTTNAKLSSQLSNARLTQALLSLADMKGRKVLDIGCGDGTYTVELFERCRPGLLHGIDPARSGIDCAQARAEGLPITFQCASAYSLPYPNTTFDWAIFRGVLHHLEHPEAALGEALRVSRRLIALEPNGLNPIVKILEKVSPYHRQHDEKSFAPWTLDKWVKAQGGCVTQRLYVGLVPMFCPNWFARIFKVLEPLVERIPLMRLLSCAQYVFTAEARDVARTPRESSA